MNLNVKEKIKNNKCGYIYLLRMFDDDGDVVYKIGRCEDFESRMKGYKFKKIIYTIATDDCYKLENDLKCVIKNKYLITTGTEYFKCDNEIELIHLIVNISLPKKKNIEDDILSIINENKVNEEKIKEIYTEEKIKEEINKKKIFDIIKNEFNDFKHDESFGGINKYYKIKFIDGEYFFYYLDINAEKNILNFLIEFNEIYEMYENNEINKDNLWNDILHNFINCEVISKNLICDIEQREYDEYKLFFNTIDRNGLKLNKVYDINSREYIDSKKEKIYFENYKVFKDFINLNFNSFFCKYYCKILSILTSNIIINDDVYGYCDTKNITKIKGFDGDFDNIFKEIRHSGLDDNKVINIGFYTSCYSFDKEKLQFSQYIRVLKINNQYYATSRFRGGKLHIINQDNILNI
jgi:hypothetical protein